MDAKFIHAAKENLDEVFRGLSDERSGEEAVRRLQRHVEGHDGEARLALHAALGLWLQDPDTEKVRYAISLVGRLGLQEYRQGLMELRDEILSGNSRLPGYWVQFIDPVVRKLGS